MQIDGVAEPGSDPGGAASGGGNELPRSDSNSDGVNRSRTKHCCAATATVSSQHYHRCGYCQSFRYVLCVCVCVCVAIATDCCTCHHRCCYSVFQVCVYEKNVACYAHVLEHIMIFLVVQKLTFIPFHGVSINTYRQSKC